MRLKGSFSDSLGSLLNASILSGRGLASRVASTLVLLLLGLLNLGGRGRVGLLFNKLELLIVKEFGSNRLKQLVDDVGNTKLQILGRKVLGSISSLKLLDICVRDGTTVLFRSVNAENRLIFLPSLLARKVH